MDRVSKPLLGVLVATVAVLALWVVALKPSSSSNSPNGNGGGLGQFESAINKVLPLRLLRPEDGKVKVVTFSSYAYTVGPYHVAAGRFIWVTPDGEVQAI